MVGAVFPSGPKQPPAPSMPEVLLSENLLAASSFLSNKDVRCLASTCRSVRATLIASQGAKTCLWLDQMREAFPAVFHHTDLAQEQPSPSDEAEAENNEEEGQVQVTRSRINPNDITLVDDYRLAASGIPTEETTLGVNLPLLTSLLPQRYPKSIVHPGDIVIRSYGHMPQPQAEEEGEYEDEGGRGDSNSFRSYNIQVDAETCTTSASPTHSQENTTSGVIVPVVRFAGEVGTGNRCVRSDEPFPPNCLRVSPGSSRGGRAGSTSSWIKTRTARKGRKVHYSSSSTAQEAFGFGAAQDLAAKQGKSRSIPRSPMYQFLSSLSRNGGSLSGSTLDESDGTHPLDDSFDDRSQETAIHNNNSAGHQQGEKTKSRLQRLVGRLRRTKCHDNLRPFVVPTLISDDTNTTSIDVTPRLVAYYEVTIVKHPENSSSASAESSKEGDDKAESDHQTHEEDKCQCVAVGLSTSAFSIENKLPGWDGESYGYHGDDGGMFHADGPAVGRGPRFGPGDVVGCGIEYGSRRVFFTKNGEFLGYEFDRVSRKVVEDGLYPTVGVDTECPLFVNFGERPFKFDLRRFR